MRRFDKKENIIKANILAEQRHLTDKGFISEDISGGLVADNDDEGVTIQLFPFSSNFIDIINGVAKTKNDLKHLAGATFGGASEDYYNRISIALNDFYQNIYKPIQAKYIEDMKQEDKSRRRLYPQNYENK
jgi:hypothetical protein